MTEIVALLPMKGHSERVAGKNLRLLGGRPLYHWIMDSLLAVESIGSVVVDTDSEPIAEDVARSFLGVTIRERPSDLRGDQIPMHDVVARFVSETPAGEVFLQTHATNPFVRPQTLTLAIETFLQDGEHDSLMSVTEWRTRLYDSFGRPLNHDPDVLLRTQDLAPVLEENSNIYVASREVVLKTGQRVGRNPRLFAIDRFEALDIDEEIDFSIAECLVAGRGGV